MKNLHLTTLRSGIALLLVLCMTVGFIPCFTVTVRAEEAKPIYVSLGDSMTNGYGLTGYNKKGSQGYMEAIDSIYPSIVAEHFGWELYQLATSSVRAEDLHYILEYGQENAYPGDDWTANEIANHPVRWGSPAAGGAEKVAQNFQNTIRDAKVVSMAVGNANFGVYFMDMMTSYFGYSHRNIDYSGHTLEAALDLINADAQMRAMINNTFSEVLVYLTQYLPEETAKVLADRMSYTMASYFVHFEGLMDRIVELNPDIEIIIVGLMNHMSYFKIDITSNGVTKHLDMAELLDLLLEPINLYLAKMPADKQANGEYPNAKIYYAELDRIETQSKTFKDAYKQDGNVIRDRFVTDIVGTSDDQGLIWSMMIPALGVKTITLNDILTFESYVYGSDKKNDATEQIRGLIAYNADEARATKTSSIVAYLAFENAILDALEMTPNLNLDEIVMPDNNEQGVMGIIAANMGNVLTETPITNAAIEDNIEKVASVYVDTVIAPTLDPSMDADQTAAALRGAVEEAMQSPEVKALVSAYVMPKTMASDLNASELLSGLLCMYGRMSLANGMSGHPTEKDHANMAKEIIAAYGNNTAEDAVAEQAMSILGNVYKLLSTYRAEIAATQPQAISAKIPMDDDFKYVAIGDTSAVSKSYVDGVAAALNEDAAKNGVGPIKMVNLAKKDNTVADELANLSDVAGADLITIGFSNVTFLSKTLQNKVVIDWASCVGEENVHYVEELLVTIDETLEGSGMPAQFKDYVKNLLECYAYSAAEYIFGMPKLIEAIQEVNPDAVIVIVGMYNPLKGVEISLDAQSSLGFGDYIDYLVDIVAAQGFAYAVSTDNVIYVDAREVETNSINSKLDMMGMLTLLTKIQNMYPTANGHAYIKDQIMKALTLTYGLLGDADGNGKIQTNDAKLVLQHIVKMPVQLDLSVCDVDGNGKIQTNDAKLILQYIVKIIPQFPAEK